VVQAPHARLEGKRAEGGRVCVGRNIHALTRKVCARQRLPARFEDVSRGSLGERWVGHGAGASACQAFVWSRLQTMRKRDVDRG
jgi:hypothetical protein